MLILRQISEKGRRQMIDQYEAILVKLEEERRRIDAEISDLKRIIARRAGKAASEPGVELARDMADTVRASVGPGTAREELLGILRSDGGWMNLQTISEIRGKTDGATRQALRLMIKNKLIEARQEDGKNLYRIQPRLPGLEPLEETWPGEDGGILAQGQNPVPPLEHPRLTE